MNDVRYKYYIKGMNKKFTNIALFGGYGVTKPEENNACIDNFFVYDAETNEILEQISVPMLTMHYENANDNVTLALSNELGLIFKTTGKDSATKMLALSKLDIQIRKIINDRKDTD